MCNSSFHWNTGTFVGLLIGLISIVVSCGRRRPEEKERDGGLVGWWNRERQRAWPDGGIVRTHMSFKFLSYMGTVCDTPKEF